MMGGLFSGPRALPQLPSNMPMGRVVNDMNKMFSTGAAPPQPSGGSAAQSLGQGGTNPIADLRRRTTQQALLLGNRGTIASGAVGVPYAGATLGGGR
jgi:hypothetical protein